VRLLLDSHVLVWWLTNDRRLGAKGRRRIADADSVAWVSVATIWELAIKHTLGRLDAIDSFGERILEECDRNGFLRLPIEFPHALAVADLPSIHGDPFDRMLVAQARCEGLTLLTADEQILQYGGPALDARR
jgi:PIN domain nuclease of toxin-antitoxin system